jgi:hypothetical protein
VSAEVKVTTRPPCDLCGTPALYDARTSAGPWGFLCGPCWDRAGVGQLGTGHGQALVVEGEDPAAGDRCGLCDHSRAVHRRAADPWSMLGRECLTAGCPCARYVEQPTEGVTP